MYHLCLGFSDTSGDYYKHALVTLISVFEHTKTRLCAHLIVDETCTDEKRRHFEKVCARYGQSLEIHSIRDMSASLVDRVPAYLGKGALFRLFIPELIPEDRIVYLDCDIVCQLDIKELFDFDMGESTLCAALDLGPECDGLLSTYLEKLGVPPAYYVNTGVLLLDAAKLRSQYPGFRAEAEALLMEHECRWADQDCINLMFPNRIFNLDSTTACDRNEATPVPKTSGSFFARLDPGAQSGSIGILPAKFNYCIDISMVQAYLPGTAYQDKIIHYTCLKPWKMLYPATLLYWKYYCLHFSPREAFECMESQDLSHLAPIVRKLLREPMTFLIDFEDLLPLFRFIHENKTAWRWLKRAHEISRTGIVGFTVGRLFPKRKKADLSK